MCFQRVKFLAECAGACAAKLSLTISISISLDTESCETILDIPTTYSTGQTIVQGEIGTLFIDGFQRTLK